MTPRVVAAISRDLVCGLHSTRPRRAMVATRYGIGIDVGGTFTDIVVYDARTGRQASHKELTTHEDPSRGVMTGINRLLGASAITATEIGRLVHATTLF